jgi:hypothetical protein
MEALRINRTAELIHMTGWTFEELDRQPRKRVKELELYLSMRAGIQAEKRQIEGR